MIEICARAFFLDERTKNDTNQMKKVNQIHCQIENQEKTEARQTTQTGNS